MVADKWSQLKPQLSPEARAEAERLARRPITAERLAEIAARDAAAQAAPWNIYECRDCRETHLDGEACFERTLGVADESFVNHARADVPDLVAHVRELEARLAATSERERQREADMERLGESLRALRASASSR